MGFSDHEKQRLLQQVDSLCLYVQKFRDETIYSLEYYKKAFEAEKADSDAAARKIAELKSDKENLEAEVQRLKVLISKVADGTTCSDSKDGGCEAHGFSSFEPDEKCPCAEANEIKAEIERQNNDLFMPEPKKSGKIKARLVKQGQSKPLNNDEFLSGSCECKDRKITELQAELASLKSDIDTLIFQRNRLATERSDLLGEIDTLRLDCKDLKNVIVGLCRHMRRWGNDEDGIPEYANADFVRAMKMCWKEMRDSIGEQPKKESTDIIRGILQRSPKTTQDKGIQILINFEDWLILCEKLKWYGEERLSL